MTFGVYDGSTLLAKLVVPLTMASNVPLLSSDALNLKRYTKRTLAQRWELTTNLEPLSDGANLLFSRLVSKGSWDTFTISAPQNYGVTKSLTTDAPITATGSTGDTQVTITGNNGLIPAGCFIRFFNHSKVYMVTSNASSSTLNIFPGLIANLNNVGMFYKKDVYLNAYLSVENIKGMIYEDGILMDNGSMTFIEAI